MEKKNCHKLTSLFRAQFTIISKLDGKYSKNCTTFDKASDYKYFTYHGRVQPWTDNHLPEPYATAFPKRA
jgi:hypothetical protein